MNLALALLHAFILQNVHLHVVDLGKPVDVYRFAKSFCESQPCLDVLVSRSVIKKIVAKIHIQSQES